VYAPFVDSARYAADMRNHYWSVLRREKDISKGKDRAADYYTVTSPDNVAPYPAPKTKIADVAKSDSGSNFGRVARVKGVMTDFVNARLTSDVSGIQAQYWVDFFKAYAEGAQKDELDAKITRIITAQRVEQGLESDDLRELLEQWAARLPPSETWKQDE